MTPTSPSTEHALAAGPDVAPVAGQVLLSGTLRVAAQATQVVAGFGAGVVMARLLTPYDFGLMAMVGSLTAFIGSFRDFGLPSATVYEDQIDTQQMNALFWLNARLNVLIVLFMAGAAPVLAWFYSESRVIAITLALAVGIFGIGLTVPYESLLVRRMRFGLLTLIETGALLASVVVGISLGLLGAGPWALVGQTLTNLLLKSAALWWTGSWRPQLARSQQADLRSILSYSRHVTGARLIAHIGRNLDRVVVGYTSGASAMGLYDRSYQWSVFPVVNIYGPLLSVAVSNLSRVRHDTAAYRAAARRSLLPIFTICLPVLAFMVVAAGPVVRLLLGEQWVSAIPLFRMLCAASFVGCVSTVTKTLYLSQGQTRRQLHWGLLSTPVFILAVLLGSRWGAYGVAAGFALATALLAWPSVFFCLRDSRLRVRDFAGVVWRPTVASLLAAGLLLAVEQLWALPQALLANLLLSGTLFAFCYAAGWLLLPGGRRIARETLGILADIVRARARSSTRA